MARLIAIGEIKPATRKEIREKLALYEKDLKSCQEDLRKRYKNGNPPHMPNAVTLLRKECKRRIAYYLPAIKELKWVLGCGE